MNITTQNTKINGIKLYFRTCGGSSLPTLVFLPGWGARLGGNRYLNGCDAVIRAFARDYQVIAVESPGFMRSQTPDPAWQVSHYAECLHQLLDKLNVSQPVLLGNSYGGGIATVYADLYAKEVRAIVLVDSTLSSAYPETPMVKALNHKYISRLKSARRPMLLKKLDIWTYWATPLSQISAGEVALKVAIAESAARSGFSVDYSTLQVPILMLWGRNDVKTHPVFYAREVAKQLLHGTLVEYGGDVGTIYRKPQMIANLVSKNLPALLA